MIIEEGDNDVESESDVDGDTFDSSAVDQVPASGDSVYPSDYLQAFTHFTYLYTNKKVLVCDLQGVYNTESVPPTFELADPAIHYSSKRREMVLWAHRQRPEGHAALLQHTPMHQNLQAHAIEQKEQVLAQTVALRLRNRSLAD